MVHLHLWCFKSTAIWEESDKSFTYVWRNWYLEKETFRSQFQVIGFKQKFTFGC